ncbi:MAG: hypothetical protein ACTH07_05595 [Microbacterium sp.]
MSDKEKEEIVLFFLGAFIVAVGAPALAAAFIPEVRSALLDWHILTTDDVILPIISGAGLDLARILIVVAALLLFIFLGILTGRRIASIRREKNGSTR